MASFVRISALIWADLLAAFAMYVMMNYLTNVWNLSTTHAAGIINIWNGITPVLAIVFAVVVDTFMGDFYMLGFSRISYSIGLGLLSMSTPPVLGPCHNYKEECIGHTQKVLFYIALPLISVGMAGHVVSLPPFFCAQFNESENENRSGRETEKGAKIFMQILGSIMVIVVPIVGSVGLPYIKPWSLQFGIPAIFSVVTTFMFFTGFREYKHIKPGEQEPNKWKVRSVREVEDTKIGIQMLPMWLTFIVIGIVLSIGNTYFLEQADHMDRKLGKIKVSIPIFLLFFNTTSYIFAHLYSLLTICSKKYAPPIGIALGVVFSILCCVTAAKVETRRLHRIRDHGLLDKPDESVPMSIFALLPQFMLLAAVDGISNISIVGFFRHQTPESMHKYLAYFTKGVLGLGSMASVLSVYVVGKLSVRNNNPNWFQDTINKSRLDRYYMVLAVLSVGNLVVYVIVAYFYKYKEPPVGDDNIELEGGTMDEGFQEK